MTIISELEAYALAHNIGQIILPQKGDTAQLKHATLYSSQVDFADHHQYFINDAAILHVTRFDPANVVEFGESLSVNIIESVNGSDHETVATIYHRQRHMPIVKHVCQTVTKPSQVVFGLGLNIFTHRLLFLDTIHYSSGGALGGSLSRHLQGTLKF